MVSLLRALSLALQRTDFLYLAALYNLVVFLVFFAVYMLLDFRTHFRTDADVSTTGKLYFALMLHATGNTDVSPKTRTARAFVALHVLATYAQLMLVFLG